MKLMNRLLVVGLLLLSTGPLQAADPVAELLQKGLMQEEAQRDVVAAIQTYQDVLLRIDAQRQFAATAVFRLDES